MADHVRVMVEQGKKKAIACAFDWPGWDRSAKSEEQALERLEAYRERYAKVADLAGLGDEFRMAGPIAVVEYMEGGPSTDFHGVSVKSAGAEQVQMTEAECERKIALLRACWTYFDDVASRVSPELRKGPRGGGRDRDRIVRHTNAAEIDDFASRVGVKWPWDTTWHDPVALAEYRLAFCEGLRAANSRGPSLKTWTVQFLIRRCAYHMLDHAWEMEDRDLNVTD
jgi:hypothetical protein